MRILLVPVLLALLYLTLTAPRLRKKPFTAPPLLAHRGLHNLKQNIPENSLAAFDAAAQAGYGIELDVQLTADGQLAVFHDDNLTRLCGHDGLVRETPLSELSALPILSTSQTIPTLGQALQQINGQVPLLIELKTNSKSFRDISDLAAQTMRALESYKGAYLVESFNPLALWALRRLNPMIIRGQLVRQSGGGLRQRLAALPLSALLCNFISRPDFIAYDQRMDSSFSIQVQRRLFRTPLAVWTVKSDADCRRLKNRAEMIIFEGFRPKRG